MSRRTKAVEAVAFSPSQPLVATADTSGAISLWNSQTGALQRTLLGHQTSAESLAFSPDGLLVLSGDARGEIRLWNVGDGQELYPLPALHGPILTCSFSPDSQYFLVSGTGTAYLWDLQQRSISRKFKDYYDIVCSWFAPDGKTFFLSNGQGGYLDWLDTQTGELLQRWDVTDAAVTALACTKDNQTLFIWDSMKIGVWDLLAGKQIHTLADNSENGRDELEYVFNGVLAANETFIAAVGINGTVVTLDLSGSVIQRFVGHTDAVFAVTLSPDDQMLLTGSLDSTARLWDVETGTELQRLKP
ncbi:MAG: hypothetical protein GC204_00685 [Chloroflexi bacterium]|nr:hypothetical protein [Chloroflexota bacterium]